jgi:hypothetical protein
MNPEDYYNLMTMGLTTPLQHPDQMKPLDIMKCATTFADHSFRFYPIATITSNVERYHHTPHSALLMIKKPLFGQCCKAAKQVVLSDDEDGLQTAFLLPP